MSISELLVILLVSLFVLKPEDLKIFIGYIKKIKQFVNNGQHQIMKHLSLEDQPTQEMVQQIDESEQINLYLLKIMKMGYEYDGEYSLAEIKKFYRSLENKQINANAKK